MLVKPLHRQISPEHHAAPKDVEQHSSTNASCVLLNLPITSDTARPHLLLLSHLSQASTDIIMRKVKLLLAECHRLHLPARPSA
jgi:hypothetical protein